MRTIITKLRKLQIELGLVDGKLQVKAPAGALTDDILAEIKQEKEFLLSYITAVKGRDSYMPLHKAAPQENGYPLTSAQKRLYFLYVMNRDTLAYNMPYVVRLEGVPDKDRIGAAFQQLVDRHDSLRTRFVLAAHEPLQQVVPDLSFEVKCYLSEGRGEEELIADFVRPFNLEQAPLLRVALVTAAPDSHLLLVDMHHIIADGISQSILQKEFMQLYHGEMLQALPFQFPDFAMWHMKEEQQSLLKQQEAFWLQEFETVPAVLTLPLDGERPKIKDDNGDTFQCILTEAETAALRMIAQEDNATLFMVLLTAFKVLLSRLSGQEDIVVGVPVAGRIHNDLQGIIGMFVNTLPIRSLPEGNYSFRQFLQHIKQKTLSCLDHQLYPYEALIEALELERDTSRNPLFDVMFSFQEEKDTIWNLNGLSMMPLTANRKAAMFDLSLTATAQEQQIKLEFEYTSSLLTEASVMRFASCFRQIIAQVADNRDILLTDIDILSFEEKQQLLHDFNNNQADFPKRETVVDLFAVQAMLSPFHIAVMRDDKFVTYQELDLRSNQLSRFMRERVGICQGSIVMIYMHKDVEVVEAVLATWKAGGAFLPVAAGIPDERLVYMIQDIRPGLIVTDLSLSGQVTSLLKQEGLEIPCLCAGSGQASEVSLHYMDSVRTDFPTDQVAYQVVPEDIAYLIYTSGSTGNPKAVMVHHQPYTNLLFSWKKEYHLSAFPVNLLQIASIGFDVFVGDLGRTLVNGGMMVLCREDIRLDFVAMSSLLARHHISLFESTPALIIPFMEYLFEQQIDISALKLIIIGSDICRCEDFRKITEWVGDRIRVINSYGITEATIDSSYYEAPLEQLPLTGVVPIGKPMSNMTMYVLNKWKALLPIGASGEIYIGGDGVSGGYFGQERLTDERFVDDPFRPGHKMYRTGDGGRWLPDGNLLMTGRLDQQVKIKGNRVELGEVESRLRGLPEIKDVVVMVCSNGDSHFLAAYYVAAGVIARVTFREFLSSCLPEYMIPVAYVHMEHLPLTVNGKVNRKALPAPLIIQEESQQEVLTAAESALLEVWSHVLKNAAIAVTDNFFALGGDSIKSIQIRSRIRSKGYDMEVKDIFTDQTVRELARKLKAVTAVTDQVAVQGRGPLTPMQQRYFELPSTNKNHYNQSVILDFPAVVTADVIRQVFSQLQRHHDALRMVFRKDGAEMIQENLSQELPLLLTEYNWPSQDKADEIAFLLEANKVQYAMNVATGPLMRLALFHLKGYSRLLIVTSHLVMDGISWRILFEDIDTLLGQQQRGEPLQLPLKTDAFLSWSGQLRQYLQGAVYKQAKPYWASVLNRYTNSLTPDFPGGNNLVKYAAVRSFTLDQEQTGLLLQAVHLPFNTQINDILLAALLISLRKMYGTDGWMIELESHGREEIMPGMKVDRTVGWFSSIYPVLLEINGEDYGTVIRQVKEQLRQVPNKGMDYLLYRYLDPAFRTEVLQAIPNIPVNFNYLGQFDSDIQHSAYTLSFDGKGTEADPERTMEYDWEITGQVVNRELTMNLTYSSGLYQEETITRLMELYQSSLSALISYCCDFKNVLLSPSDLTYRQLSLSQLDALQQTYLLEDVYPLSPMQEGMLFHHLIEPASDQYFEQMTLHLAGDLQVAVVEESMNALMDRYAVLRTVFLHDIHERPLQVVLKHRQLDFLFEDVTSRCAEGNKEAVIQQYQLQDRSRPFNPATDVLIRLIVLKTAVNAFTFIWSHHHIVMDGWCMGIIMKEFREIYENSISGRQTLLPWVKKYALYIDWLEKQPKEQAGSFWRTYLDGYDAPVSLMQRKNALPSSGARQSESLTLSRDLEQLLHKIGGDFGVTLYTILQVAWGIVLAKYEDTSDVVFGSVVSGRSGEIEGVEDMVGLFINTVPVRISYGADDTIATLLRQVQALALAAEPYHYYSLPEIQAASSLGRELINHILVFENYPVADEIRNNQEKEGIPVSFNTTGVEVFEKDNYDLSMSIIPGSALLLRFDYDPAVYAPSTIRQALHHLEQVIGAVAATPEQLVSDIEIITRGEKNRILYQFNDTLTPYPETATFISLFRDCVRKYPLHPAIIHGEQQLSYQELDALSNKYIHALCNRHIAPGQIIPMLLQRSIHLVAGMIGLQKAGYAFLAIDVRNPADRIARILQDSKAPLIITDEASSYLVQGNTGAEIIVLKAGTPAFDEEAIVDTGVVPAAQDLAYCIYTSGSSGEPKGVLLHQQGMANHFLGIADELALGVGDRFAQTAECSFDIFVMQALILLTTGGCTCIAEREEVLDPYRLSDFLKRHRITVAELVPSVIRALLDAGTFDADAGLRWMISSGEKITAPLVKDWYDAYPAIPLVNAYGPAETSDDVTACVIPPGPADGDISVGKPLPNIHILILNRELKLCPIGIKGEVCIAGWAVGKGYWQQEQATAERFVRNPYNYTGDDRFDIIYRTGDIGYWREDGHIMLVGRNDSLVKVRGARIEIGEVEKALAAIDGVQEVAVIVRETDRQLCAYYTSQPVLDSTYMRREAASKLPDFMVPQYFVQLESFPRTLNGKMDRKQLPAPAPAEDYLYVAPSGETERQLIDIWAEVLQQDPSMIGIHHNFFDLGGHSLKTVLLANVIRKTFHVDFSLKQLFDLQTVKAQAQLIEGAIWLLDSSQTTSEDRYELTV